MSLYHSTDKIIDELPNQNAQKRLNNLLGTNFLMKKIRRLPASEIGHFRVGSFFLAMGLGLLSYHFYRKYLEQRMVTSHGYYKLTKLDPINAGDQFLQPVKDSGQAETRTNTLYYRMPEKEFNMLYKNRAAFIQGEFDHDKEILISKGSGYEIITPFYYYNLITPDIYNKQQTADGQTKDSYNKERAAIAVRRGW
jgi:hypothetical protein